MRRPQLLQNPNTRFRRSEVAEKKASIMDIVNVMSSIAAIAAILIGVWQFRISDEKSEMQLSLIRQERLDRIKDSRAQLCVDSTSYNLYMDRPHEGAAWYYSLHFRNIGQRATNKVKVIGAVVAYDFMSPKSEALEVDTFEYVNPVVPSGRFEFTGGVPLKKLREYYIKIKVSMFDDVLDSSFVSHYYYRLSLNRLYPLNEDESGDLFEPTQSDVNKIDSLMYRYFRF